MFSVIEKATGQWIGRVGPLQPEGWPEVIHLIDPANEPFRRLAGRLGSAPRGTVQLPAPFSATDLEVSAQDRVTWRARPGR